MSFRRCPQFCLLVVLFTGFVAGTVSAQTDESSSQSENQAAADGTNVLGSPYVELDSWIYPAIERLAALGYIHSDYLDMRPWTRIECAHLVEEAGDEIRVRDSVPEEIDQLYTTLQNEFRRELDTSGGESSWSIQLELFLPHPVWVTGLEASLRDSSTGPCLFSKVRRIHLVDSDMPSMRGSLQYDDTRGPHNRSNQLEMTSSPGFLQFSSFLEPDGEGFQQSFPQINESSEFCAQSLSRRRVWNSTARFNQICYRPVRL